MVNSTNWCNCIFFWDADFKKRGKKDIYLIMKAIFIVGKLDTQKCIKKNHPITIIWR